MNRLTLIALASLTQITMGADKLAKARVLFFKERKNLLESGQPFAFANTLDKNITFNSKFDGKTLPVSRNDGVPAKMASEAHQDFEAKDFRACGLKEKPSELIGYRFESRMLAREGFELTEQVDVVLASLAKRYKGIERESLVKGGEGVDHVEPPSKKKRGK